MFVYHLLMPTTPTIRRTELPELLTTSEAASYLRLHVDTVVKSLRTGRLRGVKVGNRWLIRAEDLVQFTQPKDAA